MINPAIEEDLKRMSLNDVNYADYIKENYVPVEELQEIRQEIKSQYRVVLKTDNPDDWWVKWNECVDECLKIIDTHISALNNDQFERIWNHTVEEMKRRKIYEDILEEAEEYDSETMSGSLLTDDDLRLLINDAIKEKKVEQDKVTQWINDNADFIKEMARMLEENE